VDRDNQLLAALPDDEERAVRAAAVRRRFAKNEVIFHEGDPGDTVHLVERGHVAIRVSTLLGDIVTLSVLGPGESFGEQALLAADARRTATAAAVDAVETLSLAREQFEDLRRRLPVVDRLLVDLLAAQVRRLSAHLLEALHADADTRVLRRVADLVRMFGDGATDGEVSLPFTQEEIATMAGTTRPTANRALKVAEEDGLVRLARGRVVVTDPSRLVARATP